MKRATTCAFLAIVVGLVGADCRAFGQDAKAPEKRIADLERQIALMQEELRALKEQMRPKAPKVSQAVRLKYASANEIVETLNLLVGGKGRGIEIVAEPISNSLLVSAPAEKLDEVIRLISATDALSK